MGIRKLIEARFVADGRGRYFWDVKDKGLISGDQTLASGGFADGDVIIVCVGP